MPSLDYPSLDYIDSHIHFWDPKKLNYAWLKEVPAIAGAYLPQNLADRLKEQADFSLKGIVFVQADCDHQQGLAEAAWVSELASHAPIQGIVAFAPLEKGKEVKPYLDALKAYPLVKRGVYAA
ncbi:MAG: hypothetical protein R2865_16455 [Deinococcales bacterium]